MKEHRAEVNYILVMKVKTHIFLSGDPLLSVYMTKAAKHFSNGMPT